MLHSAPALVREAARRIAWLGADRVRITAGWSALAPAPTARDASRPAVRPDRLAHLSARAVAAPRPRGQGGHVRPGLDVMLDVAFWAPRWAVAARPSSRPTARPGRPTRRSSGTSPQPSRAATTARSPTPSAPAKPCRPCACTRRGTSRTTRPSCARSGSAAAGAGRPRRRTSTGRCTTPPTTRSRRGRRATSCWSAARRRRARAGPDAAACAPLRFLRELACVDAGLRPAAHSRVPRLPAAARRRLGPPPVLALDHPGDLGPRPRRRAAGRPGPPRGACSARWPTAAGSRARLPLYQTEYAYETNPPDPTAPLRDRGAGALPRLVDLPGLARSRHPDVRPVPAARHRPARRRVAAPARDWSDFQTGLFFADGTPKPAAQAFRMPFWAQVQDAGGQPSVLLFGGVRPARGPRRRAGRAPRRARPTPGIRST